MLAIINPDRSITHMLRPMPDEITCQAASSAWLAGEPDAHAIKEPPTQTRWALCVTLPAPGKDA